MYRNDTETLPSTSRQDGGTERTQVCLSMSDVEAGTQSDLCILYYAHSTATRRIPAQIWDFEWLILTSTLSMN